MHHKARNLAIAAFPHSTLTPGERDLRTIQHLRVRLPRTCIRQMEGNVSDLFSIVFKPLRFSNLRKLYIILSVFEDWWDGHDSRGNRITAENSIFKCLNAIKNILPRLEVLKLCVHAEALLRTDYLTRWELWVSRLETSPDDDS